MGDTLTKEQKMAIENRGGKLLVSAAAGSGKTMVLVERLMSYILDPVYPANIDDFLIITYTKAAASELRGKIAAKLSALISESPQNKHLQHQLQRLYLAKISTVHGFCSDLIRQYAYRLDISADFRVADEGECLQLRQKALEKIMNDAYGADAHADCYAFIDAQGLGRDDRQIPEIILKVYDSARCHLNPEEWLDWCVIDGTQIDDISQTPWGKFLIDDLKQFLCGYIDAFRRCVSAASFVDAMEKPIALFSETISQLQALCDCDSWDEIVKRKHVDFGRLTFSKSCADLQLAEQMKAVRNACKEGLSKRLRNFTDDSRQVTADFAITINAAKGLILLVREFSKYYDTLKKNRGILDFGDLEHLTLDLLRGKNRAGITSVANEVSDHFREIMVDEYQDSNEIQDAIFSALTHKKQNCFMVGDVKQSIYQFRLADPSIFIDKYNTYDDATVAKPGEGRRILLSHNFRSSGGVIDAVNDIFSQCMSNAVGDLNYGEEEMLREGIPHIPLNEPDVSLCCIDVQNDTYDEESKFVAEEISTLLDGNHTVRDGDKLRPIQPEDIVILLRSPGSVGNAFQYALQENGIRCTIGDTTDILCTEEIATIRGILQIINNPLQDIPMIGVLASPVFGFSADDLADLRSKNKKCDIYTLLLNSDSKKAKYFVEVFFQLRTSSRMLSVTQLLSKIYEKLNLLAIYGSMPDGMSKCENLRTFFQVATNYENTGPKDLFHFLEFLESCDERGLVGTTAQQEKGAVTIMSIHKSKGLEFPVVFLCGLSRSFNQENARAQVLCHKELGLGLDCIDSNLRIRYPSIAKHAVSTKILREGVSEELRVLYVALTRARDRLIMTYASRNISGRLQDIAMRLDMCSSEMLASEADCPGWWVVQSALTRSESGALFAVSGKPNCAKVSRSPWDIKLIEVNDSPVCSSDEKIIKDTIPDGVMERFACGLNFTYGHNFATETPSKLTATQLKGRALDMEISEGTNTTKSLSFRKAGSISEKSGIAYGNTVHTVMQHIDYTACHSVGTIKSDINRLVQDKLITSEQEKIIDCNSLFNFFSSPFGKKLCNSDRVLREFKFSVLDDASNYYPDVSDEKILLQGVVDLAIVEDDGIIVVDFKTDRVTESNLLDVTEKYRIQVRTYANALSRIYEKPVKSAMLYYFSLNRFVEII